MSYQLFNNGDCQDGVTGTGLLACDLTAMGDLKADILFKKGFSSAITNGSVAFDLAAYTIAVKQFNALPLTEIKEFTQDTPDNEVNTDSRGFMQVVREGKPQFSFQFTKGRCFNKTLFNKKGQSRWDHGLMFENGILMATNSTVTKLKGFDGGMFSPETYKLLQGTDLEQSNVKLQFLSATEFNERMVFIPFAQSGDLSEVRGVVETNIALDIPAAGTSLTASITSKCNTGESILDLDLATNYQVIINGVAQVPSALSYNAVTGKYTFTVTAFADTNTVKVITNDGTYDVIEDTLGNLFKGVSNTVIATA